MTFAAMSQACKANGHSLLKLHRGATFGEVSIARGPIGNVGKPAIPQDGTCLAINNLTLGVAAHSPSRTGRGGARNRADRRSYALTAAQIGNLRAAEREAGAIGLPFTRMINIHWGAAGIPLEGMAKATGRYLDLLGRLLRAEGYEPAWIWLHEGGEGKGGHCHILAHVPAALVDPITNTQKRWLRSITGRPYRTGVIHSRPIGPTLGVEVSNPDLHAVNLEVALGYVLKGANPAAVAKYHLERVEPGGLVIGRRCSTSQNIGATARKRRQAT